MKYFAPVHVTFSPQLFHEEKYFLKRITMSTTETIPLRKSPFKHENSIMKHLEEDFKRILVFAEIPEVTNFAQDKVRELCSWLCKTPNCITYRINTSLTNFHEISYRIKQHFEIPPELRIFEIPEIIIIESWNKSVELDLRKYTEEITVDASCGAAVLRGAHIFAPGVMTMPHGLNVGDKISVYVDTSGNCRKGAKVYQDEGKIFLGNGIVRKNRRELFEEGASPCGIAIRMTATISRLPQLGEACIKKGHAILQNLPSIICARILNPKPGERVLDMCAAPGNKTTHISVLMNGEGTLIALEKIKMKIQRLRSNCNDSCCENVRIHCFDATKAVGDDHEETRRDLDDPPFAKESFDRILLDGPCSALGQRPQIVNKITLKELKSYVPLQRKLFSAAVKLLKVGGVLVYSTCTITIAENEGIVAWALRNFPELKLSPTQNILNSMGLDKEFCGSPGYCIDGLNENKSKNLLRFGPESETIGFFIARFVKTEL